MKNEKLLDKIRTDEITSQTLAFMTHQEMNEDIWKELLEKKMMNKYNNVDFNYNNKKIPDCRHGPSSICCWSLFLFSWVFALN